MNETQRAAAERLADDLQRFDGAERESLRDEAAALLRELLAEQWLTSAKLDACMASRDALRDWAQECRDQVLYLLAQRDDELGRLADGFGQASVALLRELLAEPQGEPVASATSCVICPKCCHQFRAIPQDVQRLMLDAGFEPPFTHPPQQRKPLAEGQIAEIVMSFDGNDDWNLHDFARAVEKAHGITGEQK